MFYDTVSQQIVVSCFSFSEKISLAGFGSKGKRGGNFKRYYSYKFI